MIKFIVLFSLVIFFQSNSGDTSARKSANYHYKLGKAFTQNELHSEALEHFTIAIQKANNDTIIVKSNTAIAKLYSSNKNFTVAKIYLEKALLIADNKNLLQEQAEIYAVLGHTEEKQHQYNKAIEYQKRSLEKFTTLQNNFGIAKVTSNIGSIYEDLKDWNNALTFFSRAYKLIKNTKTIEEGDVLNNLGDIYRKQGDIKKSLYYTREALAIAKAINNSELAENTYKDLAKANYALKKYKNAYNFRVLAEEQKEIGQKRKNSDLLNSLHEIYNSKKKETEITLLKQKNTTNNLRQKILLLLIVTIAFIVLVLIIFSLKRKKNREKLHNQKEQKLNEALKEKKEQEQILQNSIKAKTASLSKYSLHLSKKNKILQEISLKLKNISKIESGSFSVKIKNISKEIDQTLKEDKEWEDFHILFEDIYPEFSKKITKKAKEKLSTTELKLCMLLRLNMSSKEIAAILRVTPDSVRVARYRLRKKLPIQSGQDLINFMINM